MLGTAMITLLIATRNAHKVEEIRSILGREFRYLKLNDYLGHPEVIEDANTFSGNAAKKSVQLAKWLSKSKELDRQALEEDRVFVLADDSGLEVDALNGAPGVYSARFAALDSGKRGNSTAEENNRKLLELLKEVPEEERTARFRCALALTPGFKAASESGSPVCYEDEFELRTELFDGICEGRIGYAPRGQGGFGYDPLFFPERHLQTFAELGEVVKNQLSHRARALAKLRARLAEAKKREDGG